jgi:hypothetical protein
MSFIGSLKFSDLTKLLEAITTTSVAKKRDEFMKDYLTKLKKFRDEFAKQNPNAVSSSEHPVCCKLNLRHYFSSGLLVVSCNQTHSC